MCTEFVMRAIFNYCFMNICTYIRRSIAVCAVQHSTISSGMHVATPHTTPCHQSTVSAKHSRMQSHVIYNSSKMEIEPGIFAYINEWQKAIASI